MYYHLPQRNSMTVPRVDAQDYALAVDGYGIHADREDLERIGDITTCSGSFNCPGMCGPMVTFVLVKYEDWELRLGHRQQQAVCWSDRKLSARQNIPDSSPSLDKSLVTLSSSATASVRYSVTTSCSCRPQGKRKELATLLSFLLLLARAAAISKF